MTGRSPSPTRSDTSASSSHSLSYQNILNNNNIMESNNEQLIMLRKRSTRPIGSPSSTHQMSPEPKRVKRDDHPTYPQENEHILMLRNKRIVDSPSPSGQMSPEAKKSRRDDQSDDEETESPKSSHYYFDAGGGGRISSGGVIASTGMVVPPAGSVIRKPSSASIASTISSSSSSAPANNSMQGSQSKERSPKCAQCQNHGELVRVKGHKRYCPWRSCQCYKCNVTYDRRRVMASQVAVRRAQKQDEDRAREIIEATRSAVQTREDVRAAEMLSNNSTSQGPGIEPPNFYGSRREGGSECGVSLPLPLPLPPHPAMLPVSAPSSLHNSHHPHHHPHLPPHHPAHLNLSVAAAMATSSSSSRRIIPVDDDESQSTPLPIITSPPISSKDRGMSSDTEVESVDNKSNEGGRSASRSTTDRDSVRGRSPKPALLDHLGGRKGSPINIGGVSGSVTPSTTASNSILAGRMYGGPRSATGGGGTTSSSLIRSAAAAAGWPSFIDPLFARHHNGSNGTSIMALSSVGGNGATGSAMTSPMAAMAAAAAAAACGVDPATTAHLGALKMYPHFGLQGVETMTAIDEMKESVKALMEMFRLPSETDFLIYRILKDYRGDFKQASSKIFEAQCELRSWEFLREAARGVYPYYPTAATTAYYYHPVTGGNGSGNGGAAGSSASHANNTPPDLYNSINSSASHRINIATLGKAQVTPIIPAIEDNAAV